MKIFVKEIDGGSAPIQGTEVSAGYDIVATADPEIKGVIASTDENGINYYSSIDYIEYKTSLFIAPELRNIHTLCLARSSVSKYNLVLANGIGLIDNDYRGEILFRFKYIFQPEDLRINATSGVNGLVSLVNPKKIYNKGDRIGQLVAEETIRMEFPLTKDLTQTQRGEGGFGSTDKPKIQIPPVEVKANLPKTSIADIYTKSGGIATQTPYSEQIKQRTL
jgi:dUTPase